MTPRVAELCRKLKPVLGRRVDVLWAVYVSDTSAAGKAEIEQTLELLAAKHLGQDYRPDRAPFPPPPASFASAGDLPLGQVAYAGRQLGPFSLRSDRLKEHLLICGRSGSGKTNLTFVLLDAIMRRGIHTLAIDWKRGYRDLKQTHPDLRVYTIGRSVAPFRFNPLIPPTGCEPHVWIKLIVDVIASAYLGGEGVISLLVGGLDHLYREAGVFDGTVVRWPTLEELLAWLRTTKLTGRAAMWKASAERILVGMTYGEFASVLQTRDNAHLQSLLNQNVVMEMDGLSSNSDRVMFSESLVLYLYRQLLARGPQDQLTNVIVLEEAHNLLLAKQAGERESVLENSIRMIRQYGLGYIFVDQSASLLSKVAFANSYATLALSQKLQADVRAMASAMNLNDDQREALSTLPIGTAVVRLADQHPEPFLIQVPRSTVHEGQTTDETLQADQPHPFLSDSGDSGPDAPARGASGVITPLPLADTIMDSITDQSPTTPATAHRPLQPASHPSPRLTASEPPPTTPDPMTTLNRESTRFLHDIIEHPLATTVQRYERLALSRRKGNAIRESLSGAGLVMPVRLATRSGQVVLYELTDDGRRLCRLAGLDPRPAPRASLEHTFWAACAAAHFQNLGYEVLLEQPVPGDGILDVLARRDDERLAIEVETGKSDIMANITKLQGRGFHRVVLLATNPSAVIACQDALRQVGSTAAAGVTLLTWLDLEAHLRA